LAGLVILVVLALAPTPRLWAQGDRLQELRSQATAEAYAGRHAHSEQLWRELLAAQPQDLEARIWLARLAAWQKRYQESIQAYRNILHDHPEATEGILGLATVYFWEGRYEDSLEVLEKAETLAPQDMDVQLLMARSYLGQWKKKQAEEHLSRVLAARKHDQEALDVKRQLAALTLNQISFGYSLETFSFAPDAHWGSIEFSHNQPHNLFLGNLDVVNKFDEQLVRAGGSVLHRLGQRRNLRVAALFAPQGDVLANQDYDLAYGQNLGESFALNVGYRYLNFRAANLHVFHPAVEFYPYRRLGMAATYLLTKNRFPAPLPDSLTHSYYLRAQVQPTAKLLLSAGFARGIENFSTLTRDRLDQFLANTYSLGLRCELSPRYGFSLGFARQIRSTGLTQNSFGFGFFHRF
jgi:YaiO family outer membrane protein